MIHTHGISLDKSGYQISIFLISPQKCMCFWYSLELPPQGASNENPKHMFCGEIRKNINTLRLKKKTNKKKTSYQELCTLVFLREAQLCNAH